MKEGPTDPFNTYCVYEIIQYQRRMVWLVHYKYDWEDQILNEKEGSTDPFTRSTSLMKHCNINE